MATITHRGDIAASMSLMLMLSILLSWVPGVGTLVAGVVGGRVASGTLAALVAALLPALFVGVMLFFTATLLVGLPLIGAVASMGSIVLVVLQVGALLLGALIGGLLA